jgi:RNA recognition motif-containing protein
MESNERLHASSEIGRHSSTSTNICVDGGMDGSLLKRKLIVNYLPQTYTEFELRNLFTSLGEIESVRIMKDSKVRQN